jgi:hypothetical protein
MHKYILIIFLIANSCKGQEKNNNQIKKNELTNLKTLEYQLIKAENQKGLLILFPCYPCDSENTFSEFKVAEISIEKGFSVLAMNLNERLYLNLKEKQELAKQLTTIVIEQNLSKKNIFIGGFSSGGNISLLISDYLMKNKNYIQPKGVFIVDSPIDLLGLYNTAEKNLKLAYSASSIQESKWIKYLFDTELGSTLNEINNYEIYSPYTYKTENIENLKGLKNLKIRLYTEPDLKWWNEMTKNSYEDLNAFYIKKLYEKLKTEFKTDKIELIETENKGYKVNGERHPHSWSIVNINELMSWMIE